MSALEPMHGWHGLKSLAMTQRCSCLAPASLDSTIRLLDDRRQLQASGNSWAPTTE